MEVTRQRRTVVVASENVVKIEATRSAFATWDTAGDIEVVADAVHGGRSQPFGQDQILSGLELRLETVRRRYPTADFYVAIEGGLEWIDSNLFLTTWIAVSDRRRTGTSRGAAFMLPTILGELVGNNTELGVFTEDLAREFNTDPLDGMLGVLSEGRMSRQRLYVDAVLLGLQSLAARWDDVIARLEDLA